MREMKDSGVEWIGMIPSTWKNKTLRHLLIDRVGGAWGNEPANENEGTVCLRIADFDFDKGLFKECALDELTYRTYTRKQIKKLALREGDILIEKSGGGEKTPVGRAVYYDGSYGAVLYANFMERLRFKSDEINSKFVEYWLRTWYFCRCSPFYINQTIGIQNIDLTLMLAKEQIFFPLLQDQYKIADFLDQKCSEIDALTADIQAQIETLEEYKKSVITEAVTKGLDPNVEMKDSGAKWLGAIPSSWKVNKLKFSLRRNDIRKAGQHTVLSLYREFGVIPKDSRDDNHNVTSEDTSKYKFVRKGDFVINKMKAWQGSVAVSKYEGIVSPAYYVYNFINNDINKDYFHYLMRSNYKHEFRRLSGGIREGQWDLPSDALDNTVIIIPPLEEQRQIADFLDQKCSEIDQTIYEKQQQLETLAEYKKSLIYEYVTGKKEVA